MASVQGIRAGRAFVELFADDSKLVRGLNSAQKRLATFGASVRSVGTKMMGLGALATRGDGQIELTGLIAAIWAAAQTCFIRAGIGNEVKKAQE